MEKPLINKKYLLEKFPEKGGWTYTEIPEIPMGKASFGMLKVKGSIDGFEIKKYHLMPFGNGKLFLPVKAEIRKKIKKQAGDYVHVILYPDNEPLEVPEELLLCLRDEPEAFQFFNSLSEGEQHNYIKWIYSAKTDQTKVDRIAKTLIRLSKRQKFTD
ncbi:YdeI/OmpD-associated family protein [Dysgonomonas sp. ZJ709]|uniref:YdeI/OmpD-associated family protein n=1 Tax=Dysgonomonas sp. ZJ709 TaxID=2709797 RepID=UPI0013EB8BEE|nr:YdeI/OmpD-associated family protein [Dysgonomonas sp. ZJ709]